MHHCVEVFKSYKEFSKALYNHPVICWYPGKKLKLIGLLYKCQKAGNDLDLLIDDIKKVDSNFETVKTMLEEKLVKVK